MPEQSTSRSRLRRTHGEDYAPPMTKLQRTRGEVGRPTLLTESVIEIAKRMSVNGATTQEIAAALGVTRQTLWNWATQNDEIFDAIKVGGKKADDRVVQTLFERATNGESDTAAIFWLKNRRPNEWRDKRDVDLGGSVEITDNTNRQLALAALALIRTAVEDVHDEAITIEHQDAAE